jgi:hypothetical protein
VEIVWHSMFPFETENVFATFLLSCDDLTKLSVKHVAERQPVDVIAVLEPRVCNTGVMLLFKLLLNATDDKQMDKRIKTLKTTNIVI